MMSRSRLCSRPEHVGYTFGTLWKRREPRLRSCFWFADNRGRCRHFGGNASSQRLDAQLRDGIAYESNSAPRDHTRVPR